MDTLTCMKTFRAVVQEGGFSAAGRKLGYSKVLVSKYVGQLEERLNTRLLQRTTRKVSLTTAGKAYFERCVQLLDDFDDLEESIHEKSKAVKGLLRISAPVSFAELCLMPVIAAFAQTHPQVTIEITLSDRFLDLVDDNIDIAIRIAHLPDSSLIAKRLAQVEVIACATPAYLNRHGLVQHPHELQHHKLIQDTNITNSQRWIFGHGRQELTVEVDGQLKVNSARAARELALSDFGIALCPSFVVQQDINAGSLTPILSSFRPEPLGIYAVYTHKRHLSPRVRLFIEALAIHFDDDKW